MDSSSPLYLLDKVWLFPAVMTASFLLILFVGKRLSERATSAIGITAVTLCFAGSLLVGAQWVNRVNHPPAGADKAAAEQACGVGGTGAGETHAGTGTGAAHESGAPVAKPAAPAEGESAAALRAEGGAQSPEGHEPGAGAVSGSDEGGSQGTAGGGEHGGTGEGEHESVVPVCNTVTWFTMGSIHFEAGVILDGLAAIFLVVVSLISMLVHWYSTEYLHDDRRFTHYYAFLSLFTASMLFYVLGSNTLQMLVGWELVGLCSFALIGHWWEEKANSDAALKAFLTNRVGDTGLLIGIVTTFFLAGGTSFNVFHLNNWFLANKGTQGWVLCIAALCLFAGVTSKSGQFPLHTWLPDAMAGPTPVSALIHAATMVVAGVYLVARLYGVFFASLDIGSGVVIGGTYFNWVAVAGGVTTLVGGTLAFVQHDLKKVLAYSTVSQLGYMVLGLGVGAWTGAVFHFFTHAMFKACLFLCAGSVSHACHHTFDMRQMGGLKKYMRTTWICFLITGGALAGLPFMSGFWSKDEILSGAFNNGYTGVFAMGLITALMTAAYTTRAYWLTFEGEYRGHGHPHESPKVMTIPLGILATLTVVALFFNIPNFAGGATAQAWMVRFEHYVQPTFAFPSESQLALVPFTPWLAGLSVVIALVGIGLMYAYQTSNALRGLTRNPVLGFGYRVLVNKYYLDALYEDVIVRTVKGPIAAASYWVNMKIVDAVVNAFGIVTRAVGAVVYRVLDQGVVDRIVNGSGFASEGTGQFLRRSQSGKVQEYASLLFGGAVVFVVCLVLVIQLSA